MTSDPKENDIDDDPEDDDSTDMHQFSTDLEERENDDGSTDEFTKGG